MTPDKAFECAAVVACVRILADTVASLPLKVYRKLPNGGKETAVDHPLYGLLASSPNDEYTSFEWRERLMVDACVWGNHYSQLVMDGKEVVREMWPLDASRMRVVRRTKDGPKVYEYGEGNREFRPDEILHVSILGDGLKGKSLIDVCKETIGLTMSAEEFAARFFANDASPRLVFEMDSGNAAAVKEMSAAWKEAHKGVENSHLPAWLWGGMKAKLLESDLSKLQLAEVRRFQLEEIARIFRVPLHLIQSLDRATNNNIEHQGIDFVVHSIRPWLVRIEQRLQKSLFGTRESLTYFPEFNVDGLQRGDFAARTTGYARMIASGMMTPNEGRSLENMNPQEGGDQLYIQGAMVPLQMAGQQPQAQQPAA